MRFVHRPNHPQADEFGCIDVDLIGSDYEIGSAPGVISDNMPHTRHMADGKHYDSKSEFRKATRAAGCIEVGNDAAITRPKKPQALSREDRRNSIRQAIRQLQGR